MSGSPDDVDQLAALLAEKGWTAKPKAHAAFSPEEKAMAAALLRDWSEAPPIETRVFEWSWFTNTLGTRWRLAEVIDGRRWLNQSGFTEASLHEQVKRLREEGHTVREVPTQRAAA